MNTTQDQVRLRQKTATPEEVSLQAVSKSDPQRLRNPCPVAWKIDDAIIPNDAGRKHRLIVLKAGIPISNISWLF